MTLNLFIIINLISYFISLKIFFSLIGMKYHFPFRLADLCSFFFNGFLFLILSYIYYPDKLFLFLFINLNLFYIFFHLINMIVTSPRTRLIIDLKQKKNGEVILKEYLKKYNCKVIVNNRINRLQTSKQIILKNKYYSLKKGKNNFLYFISLIFLLIQKIWNSIKNTLVKNSNNGEYYLNRVFYSKGLWAFFSVF